MNDPRRKEYLALLERISDGLRQKRKLERKRRKL